MSAIVDVAIQLNPSDEWVVTTIAEGDPFELLRLRGTGLTLYMAGHGDDPNADALRKAENLLAAVSEVRDRVLARMGLGPMLDFDELTRRFDSAPSIGPDEAEDALVDSARGAA